MTSRDKYVLAGVGALAAVAAFWFMFLAPKRSELSQANADVQAAESSLQSARQEAEQFSQARLDFPTDYTTVARLGKAVPVDPDVPSLIVQLDRAANRAGVNFRKLIPESGEAGSTPATAAPAAPAAPSGDASAQGGATGASGSDSSSGATGAEGATGAAGGATGSSGSSAAPAAADAVLAATQPLGVEVGPAGLAMTRYSMTFEGSFFKMADFVSNIRSLVQRRNRQLRISGRLVTVDGISFVESDFGYPQVRAVIAATAYLLPQGQGLFAGATAQGPSGSGAATPAAPSGGTASAPPAAVVAP